MREGSGGDIIMMSKIQGPLELPRMPSISEGAGRATQPETSFKDFRLDAIDQVNAMQQDADQTVEQLLTGGDVNPAEVLTAVQKADLSFRMMLQVRNKLLQAFQEIKEIRV
jgi:flagellar hook-basal body complex protein FliE